MDLKTRKLVLIQEFIKVQNVELVSQIEKILKINSESYNFKPMSIEDLNLRIDKAMEDSRAGNLIEAKHLKKIIEGWS